MMEYRVTYCTSAVGDGVGSPEQPWIAYSGTEHAAAREMYADLVNDLGRIPEEWKVHIETREVTPWVVAREESPVDNG
jgi:hypothetical protein